MTIRSPPSPPGAGPAPGSAGAAAAWLTSPDTPRFAGTLVNRRRQRFLGIVEPIDDFNDDNA